MAGFAAMRVLLQVHSTIGFPSVEALIHPKQPSFFDAVMLDFVLRKKSKNAFNSVFFRTKQFSLSMPEPQKS